MSILDTKTMVLPSRLVSRKGSVVQFLVSAMLMVLGTGAFWFPSRADAQISQPADSRPSMWRVSPSTSLTIFVGGQNFTAQVSDADCDLQGSEWYVNGTLQARTYYSGCLATTSLILNFTSAANYLVEVNAFDLQGMYSSSVSWNVTVSVRTVVNHFVQNLHFSDSSQDC